MPGGGGLQPHQRRAWQRRIPERADEGADPQDPAPVYGVPGPTHLSPPAVTDVVAARPALYPGPAMELNTQLQIPTDQPMEPSGIVALQGPEQLD